jgi:hypothetical protein
MCAKSGKNQQLWDLGMRAEDMENTAIVTEKVNKEINQKHIE